MDLLFTDFLSQADTDRVKQAFEKLCRHGVRSWALTGGLALELHWHRLGLIGPKRPLNDIDFVVADFEDIPATLGEEFLFRHIHLAATSGQTMLQAINSDSAVRIDVFRASAATMSRVSEISTSAGTIAIVSIEDLIARTARVTLSLVEGRAVARKHANDFERLQRIADTVDMTAAWQDHRKASHPLDFSEAVSLLKKLIAANDRLLMDPEYSKDVAEICPRCRTTKNFRLADPRQILSILGYC